MNIKAIDSMHYMRPKALHCRVIEQSVLLLVLDRRQFSAISAVPKIPEGAAILLLSRDTIIADGDVMSNLIMDDVIR